MAHLCSYASLLDHKRKNCEAPSLKRGHEGRSDYETAAKQVTRNVDIDHGQEFKEALSLERRPQGTSNLGAAAKVTCAVDVEQGQEFNGHGAVLQERFAENILCCEITLSQQSKKKESNKEESNQSPQDKILKRACAPLNSGGGVLKIAISDHEKFPMTATENNLWQRLDKFWQTLEERLANLVKPSTYGDVFDRYSAGSEKILLFINAPQHLCTMNYNLLFAGDARIHEASFMQVSKLLQNLGSCGKKSLNNGDCEYNVVLSKLRERCKYGECIGCLESKQIQFKESRGGGSILANDDQQQKVQKWICAFTNTSGGVILLGITDYGKIVGVDAGKEEQDNITRKVIVMIEHMSFPITPERKVHWDIEFIPVSGCDTTQDLVVVAIKVARIEGVFLKDPESYKLSDHDAIQLIEFDQWKERMLSGPGLQIELKATENVCSEVMLCWASSFVARVPIMIRLIKEINDSVFARQEEFPVSPNGFHEYLSKDVKDLIIEITKRISLHAKLRGLMVALKSLRARLGGSQCDDVICDVLVISTALGGLHLYTVCKEGKEDECLHYSKEVSRLLKTCLVRLGGCSVRFYISSHTSSISKEVKSPLPNTQYPQGYDLKGRIEDFSLVLRALVIVLWKRPLPKPANNFFL